MKLRQVFAFAVLLACTNLLAIAQEKPQPSPANVLVEEFFKRLNELDGTPKSVDAILELFAPDGAHQTAPSASQIGTVRYNGREALAKAFGDMGQAFTSISFTIQYFSYNERAVQLVSETTAPWGTAAAVEFRSAMTDKATRKRYFVPGAAFFQIKDGKIWRSRFYTNKEEGGEVFP